MSTAFSIALSSLKAQSDAINSTGHNLANINTNGFKGSNVDFRDLVSSTIGVGGATSQYGLGVTRPLNHQIFSQGPISSSTSPWATAIQGNGFFMVKGGNDNQQLYTRDGDFTLSSTGVLQTLSGAKVQGWMSSNGVLNTTGAPGDMTLSTGSVVPPVASSKMTVSANLNAAGIAPSTSTLAVPVQATDSLGNNHTLTINFTKSTTAANAWDYNVSIPSEQLAGGVAGSTTVIPGSGGTLNFQSNGTLAPASQTPISLNIAGLADGANNINLNWSTLAVDGSSAITQFSQASTYDVTIDGNQAGQLSNIGIGTGGQIVAAYSNGTTKVAGQLALASFRNTDSLEDVGENMFSTTGQTAAPSIGLPQTGGRGEILSGSLEGSNVDIATQFTNLITFQRGYQASSRVITTADQMLQDVMAIIR